MLDDTIKILAHGNDKVFGPAARTALNNKKTSSLTKLVFRALQAGVPASQVAEALRTLRSDCLTVQGRSKRRGRAKGRGQSSKAKGRSAVVLVRDLLLAHCQIADPKIKDDDIFVKATSQGGCDVHLSPRAANIFPFGIEVKNAESLSIWKALAQAEVNAKKKKAPAIVFFKRARSPLYIAMEAEDFLSGLRQ